MNNPQDNILPTSPSPVTTEPPVDAASAQNAINEVTATPPQPQPQPETTIEQPKPVLDSATMSTATAPSPTMGDDTPLAFAAKPTTVTTTSETTKTTTETVPPSIGSSYLPPTPPPTAPVQTTTGEEPKKKAGSKIMTLVLGFVMLGAALAGGGWYYLNFMGEEATIAAVEGRTEASCTGCDGGHELVWRNGQCVWKARLCESGGSGGTTAPTGGVKTCSGGTCTCSGSYAYCGGAIDKCVSYAELTAAGGGCNKYGEVVYGIPTVYGANYSKPDANGKCAVKKCTCGTTTVCFDKTGYCDQKDANDQGLAGSNYNQMGLCALAGSYTSANANATFIPKDPNLSTSQYTCTDSKCTANAAGCTTLRYTCSGTVANNSCTNLSSTFISQTQPANSTGFEGKCGTVEQVDVMCNGVYTTSRTRINPPCEPGESSPPTTTTTPTMACTGLTRSPNTTPKIGDTLTFTCAGSVTPSTAGTLSYKFRYKIGSGALTTLPNKSATTAELTLAACGTYTVECQACTTLNGVLTCDPKWTGATQ